MKHTPIPPTPDEEGQIRSHFYDARLRAIAREYRDSFPQPQPRPAMPRKVGEMRRQSRPRPETLAEKRRQAAMARKVHSGGTGNRGGGRPRKAERCPCGAESITRTLDRWPTRGGRCPLCPQEKPCK